MRRILANTLYRRVRSADRVPDRVRPIEHASTRLGSHRTLCLYTLLALGISLGCSGGSAGNPPNGEAGSAGVGAGGASGGDGSGGKLVQSGGTSNGSSGLASSGGAPAGGSTTSGGAPSGGSSAGGRASRGGTSTSGGAPSGGTSAGGSAGGGGNGGSVGRCTGGQCADAWGTCFTQSDGFATCSAYCASIMQSCVAAGCDGWTTQEYGGVDVCQAKNAPGNSSSGACDTPLEWLAPSDARHCCCGSR
jgi:hypothetical protein